jgi:hypothetical protein
MLSSGSGPNSGMRHVPNPIKERMLLAYPHGSILLADAAERHHEKNSCFSADKM